MPFEMTRRAFAVTAAASAVSSALPAAALPPALTAAENAVRLKAARSTISLLEHSSFYFFDHCLCEATFRDIDVGEAGGEARVSRQLERLSHCLMTFEIVASEFMRRPSPGLIYVQGKRHLLARLPHLKTLIPETDFSSLERRWSEQAEADASKLDQNLRNERALALDHRIHSRWPRNATLARA